MITPETILRRNSSIFASRVDDDLVMMDEQRGLYYALNSVAGRIWEILSAPTPYSRLLQELVATYEIDLVQCAQELQPFLLRMVEQHLIEIPENTSKTPSETAI